MIAVTVPAQSHNLTVLATVKAELGITDSAEDENLRRWIAQASNVIAKYCGRTFARETVSETFRLASRMGDLVLARYPVASIVSVVENGEALVEATDYEVGFDAGFLTRLRGDAPTCWSPGKIVVEYVCGFTLLGDLPHAVERACILLVSQYRHGHARDPQLRSESTDGIGSAGYFDGLEQGGLSPEVRGLLAPFRNLRVA